MGDLLISAGIVAIVIAGLLMWLAWRKTQVKAGDIRDPDDSRLQSLVEGVSASIGDTFYYSLVRELSQFLEIDAVLLASSNDRLSYRTQAYWCDGSYIKSQSFSLLNTPCEGISGLIYLETSASNLYPKATLLKERFGI